MPDLFSNQGFRSTYKMSVTKQLHHLYFTQSLKEDKISSQIRKQPINASAHEDPDPGGIFFC